MTKRLRNGHGEMALRSSHWWLQGRPANEEQDTTVRHFGHFAFFSNLFLFFFSSSSDFVGVVDTARTENVAEFSFRFEIQHITHPLVVIDNGGLNDNHSNQKSKGVAE